MFCTAQNHMNSSVFLQKIDDKDYLKKNGFVPPPIRKISPNFTDERLSEQLMKRINDTTVFYYFHDNAMTQKTIVIKLKGTDTTAIFRLLTSLGFRRKQIPGNLLPFFENSSVNIDYEVKLSPIEIGFIYVPNDIKKRSHPPIPPMDSVSTRQTSKPKP